MFLIEQDSEVAYTVQNSRFIGFARACADEAELRRHLGEIAQRHATASHLAFAYRIRTPAGLRAHCSDAGEPGGTAGRPILAQMEGFDVINAVVAVIRYFGGIKLGAGGLVRAYGGTAKMALEACVRGPFREFAEFPVTVDYADFQNLEYQLGKAGGEILTRDFAEQIRLTIRLPATEADEFRRRFGAG